MKRGGEESCRDVPRVSKRPLRTFVGAGLLAFCLGVAACGYAHAQPFVQRLAPFTVERGDGGDYRNPFSGGLVQPRIGLRDADGDGDLDLFALNPDNVLRVYSNEGLWRFRRELATPFDSLHLRSWFRLGDLDGDGDDDMFTSGAISELLVYWNIGSAISPRFGASSDTVRRGDTIIFTQQETVPSLVDIDSDGDLDLFSGNIDGSITFYRNVGTATAPRFTFVTANYQGILVISPGAARKREGVQQPQRHGASVLDFADLDRDGDLDMLFGDYFTAKLLAFENTGTPQDASFSMARLDTAFRPDGDVVESAGFNQPVAGDIDRDGDPDILVSSLFQQAVGQPVILYENVAAPGAKALMRRRATDLSDEIDLGTFAAPAPIADAVRRGVLVGASDGSITYIAATAGPTTWRIAAVYQTLPTLFNAVPSAGDLDGDGVAEVVVGDANDGRVRLFRFEGDRLRNVPWQLDTFRVNLYAAPALADQDGDGDLDLCVGAGSGLLFFFENVGTATSPSFVRRTPAGELAGLDVGSNSTIAFTDLDRDGRTDAVVGGRQRSDSRQGTLRFYLNKPEGFQSSPAYAAIRTDRAPVPAFVTMPEGAFLLVGTSSGGILAYEDTSKAVSSFVENAPGGKLRLVGTLVGSGDRTLRIAGNIPNGRTSLVLTDMAGRDAASLELSDALDVRTVRLPSLPSGAYIVRTRQSTLGTIVLMP